LRWEEVKIAPEYDDDIRRAFLPSSYRKKRDEERKDRTRNQLLLAATKVFARTGYHRALISEIVSEAGMGQGTFYRNFRDKRDIFETLMEGFLSDLFSEFSDMSANLPMNLEEYRDASLQAIVRASRVVERNRDLCRVFLREVPSVDEEVRDVIYGAYDRLSTLAQFYLDHAIRSGFARPCNSELVSNAIIGIGKRMMDLWLSGRYPALSAEQIVREVVDFAFLGLGPEKGQGENQGTRTPG
jgi:AcrR family transcriptional regulator